MNKYTPNNFIMKKSVTFSTPTRVAPLNAVYAPLVSQGINLTLYTIGLSQTVSNILTTLNLRQDIPKNRSAMEELILRAIDQRYMNFVTVPGFINSPMSFTVLARREDLGRVSAFILPKNIFRFHQELNLCFQDSTSCPLPEAMRKELSRTVTHLRQSQLNMINPTGIRYVGFPGWFHHFPVDGRTSPRQVKTLSTLGPPPGFAPKHVVCETKELTDEEKKVLVSKVSEEITKGVAELVRHPTFTKLINNHWWSKSKDSDPREELKAELIKYKKKTQRIIDASENILKKLDKLAEVNETIPSITFLEGPKKPPLGKPPRWRSRSSYRKSRGRYRSHSNV